MAARFPVPSEARLPELIREAYEAMPGPDSGRITAIGIRLAQQLPATRASRARAWPWWLIPLLLTGAVAAAWWAGGRWFGGPERMAVEDKGKPAAGPTLDHPDDPDAESESGRRTEGQAPYGDKPSPLIYQRENLL